MNVTVQMTRGSTFSLAFYPVPLPAPVGAWSATAQLRTSLDMLVDDLTADVTPPGVDTPLGYSVTLESAAADTAVWPISTLRGDIRFVDGAGVMLFSEHFHVRVNYEVTRAA